MRFALISVLVLVSTLGCGRKDEEPPLPAGATFGWQLRSLSATRPETAPATVRELGFSRSWRAEYSGPGIAHVDIYRLKTEAAGLEMTQRWRPVPDTVTLFTPKYFLVVAWAQTERAPLTALIARLQKLD